MTTRHNVPNEMTLDRLMETVTEHPYRSYDVSRERKSSPRCRIMFTRDQVAQLESFFALDQYPKIKDRRRIADSMGITERRIQVWFQNRRAKNSRGQSHQERLTVGISRDVPVSTSVSRSPCSLRGSIVRHYPSRESQTDSDGETSVGSVHSFDSSLSSPPGGFFAKEGVEFIPSVNISTPFCNGVMYSAPARRGGRMSTSSINSSDLDNVATPSSDNTFVFNQMLSKLNATEYQAVHELDSLVESQTKLLLQVRRSCEFEFLHL